MSDIMITPGGAKVLRAMIVSCGSAGCFAAIKLIEAVTEPVALTSVGLDASGHWHMAAFSRLKDYAVDRGLTLLDTYDIARYFGGQAHIDIIHAIADHAGLGEYLGPYVGLVSHVLLPLKEGAYRNVDLRVDFDARAIVVNPEDSGVPCYHLGAIVNIALSPKQVAEILAEQRKSEAFVTAVKKIKGPIVPPEEYWEALNCTVKTARE